MTTTEKLYIKCLKIEIGLLAIWKKDNWWTLSKKTSAWTKPDNKLNLEKC